MRVNAIPVPKRAQPWAWARFAGDRYAIKYARRELVTLHAVIKRCRRQRTAVQAGGNLGIFPKYLAQYFEHVHTFEPDARSFAALSANAPEPNISRYQVALGERIGTVGLSSARRHGHGADHSGLVHIAGAGSIALRPLDSYGFRDVDLIYLDIEGYECFAVRGARETIMRCRPVLALEVNRNLTFFGLSEPDLFDELDTLGYCEADKLKNDRVFLPVEAGL
jgi:FkbM family methyltransferase